jgi:hypothetical protein
MNPPRRLTPPQAFPDLDAALAARGIALKASASCSRVDGPKEPLTSANQQPVDVNERSSPHPVAAFTGAVLGLALIGLLVFSVIKVSGESIRPDTPIINTPATSTAAPTPVAALPLPAKPAPLPPTPEVAPPQLAAASQAVPPPQPENTPEGSLRSRLHERFPLLFPAP